MSTTQQLNIKNMKKLILLVLISILVSCTKYETQPVYYKLQVNFSGLELPEEGYLDADLGYEYRVDDVDFYTDWVPDFGGYSNGGIYLSRLNDSQTPGFLNQYSAYPKPDGSFGVVHYSEYNAQLGSNMAKFTLPKSTTIESIDVANTTYVYWAIKTGDDGFGACRAYKDGDWFKVTFTGYDVNGIKTGVVDYYLADFRDGKSYIATSWEKVNLTGLGSKVKSVEISIDGTDKSEWGLNTPAYCCIDNIVYIK